MIKTINYKKYKELKNYHDIKIVDYGKFMSKIYKLDLKVNEQLTNKEYSNSSWSITKLEIDNFLSYGNNNVIEFDKLNGLTLVPGNNQIGKCVDPETEIEIKFDEKLIIKKLGFLPDELKVNKN